MLCHSLVLSYKKKNAQEKLKNKKEKKFNHSLTHVYRRERHREHKMITNLIHTHNKIFYFHYHYQGYEMDQKNCFLSKPWL